MLTVTEVLTRRRLLQSLAGLACLAMWPVARGHTQDEQPLELLAGWRANDKDWLGLLSLSATSLRPERQLELPTRAHGVHATRDGRLLAVARRPGDWLLNWHPARDMVMWQWVEPDRKLNGHLVTDVAERYVWTSETDQASGAGLVGLRDRHSLEKLDEWPSHGLDPHQLLCLPQAVGPYPAGTLLVANGGIATLPETGRTPQHDRPMQASLAALDPHTGRCLQRWELDDRCLSIRHLSWDARSERVGVALQAAHATPEERQQAPVLAIWDGQQLSTGRGHPDLQGYGGDVCAHPAGGFAVSCPRAGALAIFGGDGQFRQALPMADVCALQLRGQQLWCATREEAIRLDADNRQARLLLGEASQHLAIDNHWQ